MKIQKCIALALVCVICVICCSCGAERYGGKIEFPEAGGSVTVDYNAISYDLEQLQKKISVEKAYVYFDAVKPERNISEIFPEAQVIETDSVRTFLDFENKTNAPVTKKTVAVDKFGCFKFRTGVGQTTFDFPYTSEETVDIAKKYLHEYGVEIDESREASSAETWSQYPDENGNQIKDVIERTIIFYSTSDDGYMINHGNTVKVDVNGRGELVGIDCHVKKYANKHQVSLIPLKKAIENMGDLNVFIASPDIYGKMRIEDVELQYWQDESDGKSTLRPIYDFTVSINENEGEFHIIVQANNY